MKRILKPHSQWKHPKAKPCGCIYGSCIKCVRPDNEGRWSAAEVAAMRADYESGMPAAAVERKHGVGKKSLRGIFEVRGIPWRKYTFPTARNIGGRFVSDEPKTAAEITAMIAALPYVKVPTALRQEWKRWPMEKRGEFIARAREQLRAKGKKFAPTGPCSANVTPFDYATPAAWAIVNAANVGCTSQTAKMRLFPSSQGLIFEGELWFWAFDGYNRQKYGHDECGGERPFLHRYLYERWHGPIPKGMTVIFKDGNKNNFTRANLALRSMADCARMNHWAKNPELVRGGIAKRIAVKSWLNRGKKMNAVSRAQVGALLGGGDGIFEQLTRSKL